MFKKTVLFSHDGFPNVDNHDGRNRMLKSQKVWKILNAKQLKGAFVQLSLIILWPPSIPRLYGESFVFPCFACSHFFRSHFTSSRPKCQLFTGLHKERGRVLFYRLAPERRPGLFQGDPYNLHEFHEIVPSITFSINEYQFSAKWSQQHLISAESWQHKLFFPIERLFHRSGHNTRSELVFGVITVMVWISNLKQVCVQTGSS